MKSNGIDLNPGSSTNQLCGLYQQLKLSLLQFHPKENKDLVLPISDTCRKIHVKNSFQ